MELKFKKFEPMVPTVNQKINELINRGGTIVKERRDQIVIQRFESFAKIDQYGRVEWSSDIK
jgi:hypothetical protein